MPCLIMTIKNEGARLLEWIAHHKAVGIHRFVIASNDCEDSSDHLLNRLEQLGVVRHIANTGPYDLGIQKDAYQKARQLPEVQTSDWVMCLDVDEFLNLRQGDGKIDTFLGSLPDDAEIVPIPWRLFGDSGLRGWVGGSFCDNFTHAEAPSRRRSQYKSLIRNHQKYDFFGAHDPKFFDGSLPSPHAWVYPDGTRVPESAITKRYPADRDLMARMWSVAQINHYMCKTQEMSKMRILRGSALALSSTTKRWIKRTSKPGFDNFNRNDVAETSIQRYVTARQTFLAELLSDRQVADLHKETQRVGEELCLKASALDFTEVPGRA